jgi:hypothetical protein
MIQKHIAAQCAAAEPQLHAILCPTVCEEWTNINLTV